MSAEPSPAQIGTPSGMPPLRLAFDPGGTTGVAMRVGDRYLTCTTGTPQELWDIILKYSWQIVIYETFNAKVISRYGLYTVRLIGGIEALCYSRKIPVHSEPPAHRKAWQEQAEGILRHRGVVIHEIEGLAHLLAWEAHNTNAENI